MSVEKIKKVEELYLRIFKLIIILILTGALVVSAVFLLIGTSAMFATAKKPVPAQTAPPPSVDVSKFLNTLQAQPATPVPVEPKNKVIQPQSSMDHSVDDMMEAALQKIWLYVDGYQKACDLPKQIDKDTFLKKFPRDIFKRWFKAYGQSFADSQDAFEKAVLASPAAIEIGKDEDKRKKISVLMKSLTWHAAEWERQFEAGKAFERKEERRVKNFEMEEDAKVATIKFGAASSLHAALIAFGVFMCLALLLIFSKIETDLMDIRNLMGDGSGHKK